MKYLLKNVYIIAALSLSVGLYFSSCSSDNDHIVDDISSELRLIPSKEKIIPFENLKVSIDIDLEVLYDTYDSIRWKANGTAYGDFPTIANPWTNIDDQRDLRITDYRIGKHKAYVYGYKNGVIIDSDSIEYEVSNPKKDFISFNWDENSKDIYLHYTTGLSPVQTLPIQTGFTKIGGVDLQLYHIVDENHIQYAVLQFVPWSASWNFRSSRSITNIPDINSFDWHNNSDEGEAAQYEIEYKFHHNYITELHGLSTLIYEGDDITHTTLEEEYSKRFNYPYKGSFYPVEIWDTPSSYICIMQANNRLGSINQRGICKVIAQPRK